ncbi:polyhydroxyalkanoate depolymerase [Pseudoroseicyclus sp. H15]
MKNMFTYDLMETMRNTNQWLGATAQAIGSYPAMAGSPMAPWLKAWGEVTERSFARMVAKPAWGIPTITGADGKDHVVRVMKMVEKPFGDLIHFKVPGREPRRRRVLLVAPMSGHYATLLRKTVISLLPDCEVFVTDWHNARDIPVSAGKFDVEDYTLYLVEFMKALGSDLHVIAICQPAPLTLAATAYLAEEEPDAQPRSMTLIGGPIDPEATPTEVTDFGRSVTMGQLEQGAIQRVGFKNDGVGRLVYPGLLQLSSFISMNMETHSEAFQNQIIRAAKGEADDNDRHNVFYDEYLAVMDMTAEFYLSTVERIFKNREIARNAFTVEGKQVDIGKITRVAVKVVEGEEDDISAPGQCYAALDLLTGLPREKKAAHLEPGAGHYGIFAGKSWRNNIRPLVLKFIDENSEAPARKPMRPKIVTVNERPADSGTEPEPMRHDGTMPV